MQGARNSCVYMCMYICICIYLYASRICIYLYACRMSVRREGQVALDRKLQSPLTGFMMTAGRSSQSSRRQEQRMSSQQGSAAYPGRAKKITMRWDKLPWPWKLVAQRLTAQPRPWLIFTCGAMGSGKGYVMKWKSKLRLHKQVALCHGISIQQPVLPTTF